MEVISEKAADQNLQKSVETHGLRRAVGTWGSFTWGYADVGADVYVALGLVAGYAQGWTPFAFLITGFVYIFIGMAYTELSSTYPVAGGGQYYTLRGLGDFAGFTSGWCLLLDFSIDISLFGLATAGYLNYFLKRIWPWITQPLPWAIETIILIGILLFLNVRGIRESSKLNEIFCAVDLFNETFILVVGFIVAWSPNLLHQQIMYEKPSLHNFLFGCSIAIISYIGLESISQAAEETIRPASVVPRTSLALIFTVIIYALSFSTLSLGIMPWQVLEANKADPVAVLAQSIPFVGVIAGPFTAILAMTLIYASTNTGVMGCSRITYSMSSFRLLPKWFNKVHPKYRTPVRTILVFSGLAILQVILASISRDAMDTLANLYAFGAVTGYIFVMISLIRLRFVDPYSPRPFKMPGNIRIRYKDRLIDFPILAIVGIIGNLAILVVVMITHELGRIAGPSWLVFGFILYVLFRKAEGLPIFGNVQRDWEHQQMKVLEEAQETEILGEYKDALKLRDKKLGKYAHKEEFKV
jgi:APA family basic amino acid/polyamine antiporter